MGLKQVKFSQAFADVEIDSLSFWIQIHNLPLSSFKESTVRRQGDMIGEVQEVCFGDEEGVPYSDIVRMRIIMNIKRPFIPAIWLKKESRWIYVIYETVASIVAL